MSSSSSLKFRSTLKLLGPLFLFFLVSSSSASAKIEQWDFQKPEDYQFDPQKIEVKDGIARLKTSQPFQDSNRENFDKGTFDLNSWAGRGMVEIVAPTFQEISGQDLAVPISAGDPELVALWNFDEPNGTNLLDASSRTVAKSSDTEIVSSQTGFGYARSFDGNKSHVFIPHYQSFQFNKSFTLEAWIRPQLLDRGKPQTIFSRWQSVGAQKGFALQISPEGKLDLLVSPDGAITKHCLGETSLAGGNWYHVAAVYDGAVLQIYLNGVPDAAPMTFGEGIHSATNPIYLGAIIESKMEQFFMGAMDQVAFYTRPLTETEISAHAGNTRGLSGLWHLNERGGPLSDASGYGLHGVNFGEIQYEAEGKIGTAVHFGGSYQYIEAPVSTRFAADDSLTLMAWVKPDQIPGLGQTAALISSVSDPSNPVQAGEYSLSITGPDGVLRASASSINSAEVIGKTSLMPNIWQHVAVTWAAGRVSLYVNGVIDSSNAYTGKLTAGKSALRLGLDSKKTAGLIGSLDEAAIYRRALTPQEIAEAAGALPQGAVYTSEVKDAGSESTWRAFAWQEPLGYGKELKPSETGLLHLYHLNEKENSFADGKGEIAASPIGTYSVGGVFGEARWFSAKGYDKVISQKNFPSLSTFSVGMWFQFASSQPGLSDRLFSIGDSNPTAFRGADGRIHVSMIGAREIIGQRILRDTAWHHLMLTADGRNLFLYIDGALDGNSPFISASAEAPFVLGNLKSTDTFQGALDEASFFNYPLSRETVYQQYLQGNLHLSFQVRTSDEPSFTGAAWRDLKGNKFTAPDAGAYTSGLWHFNEKKFLGRPDEVTDAGRFANHAEVYGRPAAVPVAVSGGGISLNGSSDYVQTPDADGLHMKEFTLSAWIKPRQIQEQDTVILDKRFQKGAPSFSSYALELITGNRLSVRVGHAGGYKQLSTDTAGEITAGKWSYVAAVFNGKEIRLYINGKLTKTDSFSEDLIYDSGPLFIGRYGTMPSRFFDGEIDEVALEAHAFSDEEIAKNYSDLAPREIAGTEANLQIEKGRYFQYRAFLETKVPTASPFLNGAEIQANAFSADRPWILNQTGISYADISHFSEKTGPGHRGAVSYQLSKDGANWYYHNGRRWVIAAGSTESNTAVQVSERIHDFAKDTGIGSFFFKAFLHSPTGIEPAELDNVEVEYLPNKLTMISPNGGEAWLIGTPQVISWNSTGDVAKVRLEYSKDDFKTDFHVIAKEISNTGNYTWKIPDDAATQVKVRVMDSLEPRVHDTSDITFRLAGELQVVSPNWNERWPVGSIQEIKWKTTGSIPNVRIDYSTDDFVSTVYPVVDSVKNEGSFSWKITDPTSKNIKVRVADVRDPLVFDKSNDTFTVYGDMQLSSPAAGARWIVGSVQEIRWNTIGTVAGVQIEYQTGKNPDWIVIAEKILNQKSYSWTVPDEIDSDVKIRITDLSDKKTSITSPSFAIIGGLRLTNPRGGENWTVGSRRKIAWQTIGTMPLVNLEYKLSAKDDWTAMARQISNTGEYVWDIPAQPSDYVAVRVVDAQDPAVSADSVTPVRVIPSFLLKAPNGGESFQIGFESDIIWETQGKSDRVKLEYSKDNFKKDARVIISEASNIGRFSWTVPDDASLTARVRVSDSEISSAQDTSDSDFRIHAGFKVTMPQGGEKLEVASLATLTWNTVGTVPEVKLEYSHDDFTKDVRTIASSTPNKNRFVWTVPDDIGTAYSFRVADARDLQAQAYSEGTFNIIGHFRLLEPAGGQDVIAGTMAPIKWKGAGSVPFLQIDYSEDNFEKSFKTIAEQAPNTGVYEWTVPNLVGHEFKIRIWDPSQPDAQDVMSKSSRIVSGFRLEAPNGGEIFYVGDEVSVKWETYGLAPTVKLDYSADQFKKNIGEIADAHENIGIYKWRIPDMPTGSYRLRISDARDESAFDLSNADFKVRSRFILMSPNGGEGWPVGEKKVITWQTTGTVPAVNLEYSIDNFASVKNIAEKVPNTGSYDWTVPDNVSQDVKIRISDIKDFDAADVSDGSFRIEGVLKLDSPAGGEVWRAGEQRPIHWTTTGRVEGVRLDYSRDNFASEIKTIAESLPNTGTYNWTVPDDLSPNTKVRVTDLRDPRVQSISSGTFELAAAFLMMAPNGGEKWYASEKREIIWATVGTVREVNLEYSTDDFKSEPEIIDRGVLNSGRFTWELPREIGDTFKARVCDADSPKICDVSDTPFTIDPPFDLTYPKGGEKWVVGSDQELRWNVHGYIPRVFIQYAAGEPPVEWKTLIEELPNKGHFLFRVPDDISKHIIFRVSDYEDSSVFNVTQEPVEFIGTFQVLTPNGGEKWLAASKQKITWNTLGTAPEVRIEYSTDNFQRDIKLIESAYKNTGSYEWTVPADLAPAVKVRVQDATNEASFDTSDNPFKILPHFTLLTPNGGERWTVGDKVQIKWKKEGTVPRVRLEYGVRDSEEKPYAWQPIAELRGTQEVFDWEVPENVSSDVKIRICDERDAETTEESDKSFKILSRFKVMSPRPEELLFVDGKYQLKWETFGRVPSVKLEYASVVSKEKEPVFQLIENVWNNSGSYYWTVPDSAGENIVLKISDSREPEGATISDAFKIRGILKFDLPDGGIFWPVGSKQTIAWKTTGTISNVKLEYSTDGKTWKLIEESLLNAGSYAWLVPDDLSQTVRLRISNVQNPLVMAEAEKLISIIGEFKFTSPEAGRKWAVGSQQKIAWNTTGSVKRIWLEYAVGDEWEPIAGPADNEGSYQWAVPDAISSAIRLRVRDSENPAAVTISEPFEIMGVVQLISPVKAEVWEVGSSRRIQWTTTGTIPHIRIEGLLEEEAALNPWFLIAEKAENRNGFEWSVPDKISDRLKIRISDFRDASVSSVSPEYFSIIGNLKIQNPKGGENWIVDSSQQITWTTQGTVPSVLLEYSHDDFYRDVNMIASGVPNTGAALWTVPDAIAPEMKVRVSDFRDKRAFSLSEPFAVKGQLDFITPASDSVLKVAGKSILRWHSTGMIPQVRLEFSRDNFQRDIQVVENALENKDEYEWQVPDIISTTVKLRVTDTRDGSVSAVSSPFKVEGSLNVKFPAGGEKFQVLSAQRVLWDTVGSIPKVRLEYSRDEFVQNIQLVASEVPNQGFYEWIVPDDIGGGVKLRVLNAANYAVSSVSGGAFDIRGALSFTVSTQGQRWTVASAQKITWQNIGTIPQVRLEYSKDDFQKDIQAIEEAITNESSYEWKVPDDISDNVRLRIADVRDPEVFAVTVQPAVIAGDLKLLTPLPGTTLRVGEEAQVRWTSTGTIPGVHLEYQTASLDSANWKLITGVADNAGVYTWTVPNDISQTVRLRISDGRDTKVENISSEFMIAGKLNVLSPAGNERWIVGTSHDVLWESTGTIPEVALLYSTDGFAKDVRVLGEKVPNSGRFVWTVPDVITDGMQIRVLDTRMKDLVNHTTDAFAVVGDFVLSAPAAPVTWKVGSEVRLDWQTVGSIPKVKLEYVGSGASIPANRASFVSTLATGIDSNALVPPVPDDVRIIQDQVPNQGQYTFRVPDWIGNHGVIRISDTRDSQVAQLTPSIKIEGDFQFVIPRQGETWKTGEEKLLEWRTVGTVKNVALDYSSDHFQRDINPIQLFTPNENRMLWVIPDTFGPVQIRVRDAADAAVYALSEEVQIRGALQVIKPAVNDSISIGATAEIQWKSTGKIPQVILQYSDDGFKNQTFVIAAKVETSRLAAKDVYSYSWQIPDFISSHVQVRISDMRDPNISAVSEPFKIKGQLHTITPRGGEIWTVGSTHEISWKTEGTIPLVRLEYSRDGFQRDIQRIDAAVVNNGSYSWTVADAVSPRLWVRVLDERDASVWGVHQDSIEVQGALELVQPHGGETWIVGRDARMEWKTTGTVPEVRLEYQAVETAAQEAEWRTIADRIPNQGSFIWQVPDEVPQHLQVRLADSSNDRVFSGTQTPVRILGTLKITSPDAQVRWQVGSLQKVVWNTRGNIPQVKVEYSRDGFQNEKGILFPLIPNAGSVQWTVTDLVGKDFQIRVSDVQNPEVYAATASPIEIAGSFYLLTPLPGSRLEVGDKTDISWQTIGTVKQVRIEYSDSELFNSPKIIADNVANSGRYRWEVPDTIGKQFWIRISDVQDASIHTVSEAPFEIHGRLLLKSPQGGEIWKVGSQVPITWDTVGTIESVSVEYSIDEFQNALPIIENIPNRGRYDWRIPDVVSDRLRIRIRDSKNPDVYSAAVQPLKVQGSFTLLAPQAGEFWESGTQHAVIWQTVGSIPFVSLEYSTDNFATAMPIILGVANEGRYQWTVPNITSESLKLRLSAAHDQSVNAVTEAIEIGGTLSLLVPNGAEVWAVGEEVSIQWRTGGTIPRVRIEMSGDNFDKDVQVLDSSADNQGHYTWTVPDQIANGYRIRIRDVKNPRIGDVSDGSFKIAGRISVTSPGSMVNWPVGSTQTLEWQTRGDISTVHIEYSKDQFVTALPLAMNIQNSGRYSWEVPDLAGESIQFRISDANDPTVAGATVHPVNIQASLKLIAPLGAEVWRATESRPITWRTLGTLPHVNLEYSENDFETTQTIASSIANTGSHLWTVPNISTRNLKIRVVDSLNPEVSDQTRAPIQVVGGLKITAPAGGEVWLVGTEHPISWVSTGKIENVRLEYSTDGFRTIFPIGLRTPNSGVFSWMVPDAISKTVNVRIVDEADNSAVAETQIPFEIRGALNLLTPVGGEIWAVGTRQPISWQTTGTISHVRLEFSTDDFASDVQPIALNLDNKGVYYWDVPVLGVSGLKIRISDVNNPDVYDISKADARLAGSLELQYPAGGEIFQVGERSEIRWRSTSNISNVKLEYSTDNFETSTVVSDYVPNTGKFGWNIPDVISDDLKIKVSDAANASVFSLSRFPFRTRGSFKMITPKGGESWVAGTKQNLTWSTMGSISKVRLEYSSDNFETSIPIAANITNTGAYLWTVPEVPYSEIKIRVIAADAPSVQATTESGIHVTGRLEMITPAGNERWIVGEERVIRWQTLGYIPVVDLEYSKDRFNKDVHLIAAKVPNVGSYSWHIPNDPSKEIYVRITSSENRKIETVSPAPFAIDFYRVRWIVRDSETKDHLSGLTLTDSTGKTVSRMASPVTLEYPYGIYTTVWTKNGYGEGRSTWLADRDRSFEVLLDPQTEAVEMVRASFDYDRSKDLMKIKTWYERNGKAVPAVMESEVKIFKSGEPIKTLISSSPDSLGYFHMMWDSSVQEGDAKYLASVAITAASGKVYTSTMSYQLDIPVKEQKQPMVRHAVSSVHLKPMTSVQSMLPDMKEPELPALRPAAEPEPVQAPAAAAPSEDDHEGSVFTQQAVPTDMSEQAPKPVFEKLEKKEGQLIVPQSATLHETISVAYIGGAGSHPVLDLYDSNKRLVIRGEEMTETDTPGTYSFLIPVKGMTFVPGKSVRVSVIEQTTGRFKSADIRIESAAGALGYDKEIAGTTVLQILGQLDKLHEEIKQLEYRDRDMTAILTAVQDSISGLAGLLTEEFLDSKVLHKLNEVASELAIIAEKKGYNAGFLVAQPLGGRADLTEVGGKIRNLQVVIESLQRLYRYSSGSTSTPG